MWLLNPCCCGKWSLTDGSRKTQEGDIINLFMVENQKDFNSAVMMLFKNSNYEAAEYTYPSREVCTILKVVIATFIGVDIRR